MISWLIILILGVVAFIILRVIHIRHRLTLLVIVLLALFLTVTLGIVISKNPVDLSSTEGFFDGIKVYLGWLGNGFSNMKNIMGDAIKMDWTSTNGTLFNYTKK